MHYQDCLLLTTNDSTLILLSDPKSNTIASHPLGLYFWISACLQVHLDVEP